MTSNIAIDIALLPPADVMNAAIDLNKQLLVKQPSVLTLSSTVRVPHLTLMQAIVKEKDLVNVEAKLDYIAAAFVPLHLSGKLSSSNDVTYFQIEKTADLQNLHETIMKQFEKIVSYDTKLEDYDDAEVRQKTIDYVRNFRTLAAYENFDPHITLGLGILPSTIKKTSFVAQRLAVCHLGNFNTCKRVLFEVSL